MALSRSIWAAPALGLATWLVCGDASAYCRTTTCNAAEIDPSTGRNYDCGPPGGCMTRGEPLYWPDLCVTFGVHAAGSPRRGISYSRAQEVAEAAFQEWISADCGNGFTPSIGVVPRGEVYCDRLEFNHSGRDSVNAPGPNANIVVFRDDDWPYNDEGKTIALTTITFATRTGEILDADIEVNSAEIAISTSDTLVTSDLQSILTHEFGHFFGLAHTKDETATMNADYNGGDKSFRTLAPDDIAGICDIYPGIAEPISDCTGEEPRYGFSRYCGTADEADAGCLCAAPGKPGSSDGWLLASAGALMLVARRRRR